MLTAQMQRLAGVGGHLAGGGGGGGGGDSADRRTAGDATAACAAHDQAAQPAAGSGSSPGWSWGGAGGTAQVFELVGCAVFTIMPLPRARRPGPVPWVWYAPTLLQSNLPDVGARDGAEVWMFERFLAAGIGVAGIDVGESYGSPAGTARYDALYDELTQQHGDVDHVQRFSRKPVRAMYHQHHDAVRVPTAVPCSVCEGTLHAVGACSVCEKPLVLRPAFRV